MAIDREFDEQAAKHNSEARLQRIAEEGCAAVARATAWAKAPAGTKYEDVQIGEGQ